MNGPFEGTPLSKMVNILLKETTTYLRPDQVPPEMKSVFDAIGLPGEKYRTTKFKFTITDTFEPVGMQWSGGSKNDYVAVNLKTGESKPLKDPRPWPHNQGPLPAFPMKPDYAIAKRTTFRGKNMGVEFLIHPSNAPDALPSPEEQGEGLSREEQIVLVATRSLKPSYGGIKNYRYQEAKRQTGITPEQWQAARESLMGNKYLNKRGAITPKGRNAIAHMGTRGLDQFRQAKAPSALTRPAIPSIPDES